MEYRLVTQDQVIESNSTNVDYIGLSPIFSTKTKTSELANSSWFKGLKKIRKLSNKPIISIGGIDKTNASESQKTWLRWYCRNYRDF